jgi:hypothetical protein
MSFAVLPNPRTLIVIKELSAMYLIIYKTTHINGRYYIGRHQTTDLNDGYLGSGNWVSRIKNKSLLTREIIAEAETFEELRHLEEHYISIHYDDPLCMNLTRSSMGWESGSNNPGPSITRERVKNGTHNFIGPSLNKTRVLNGTHPFVGGELQRNRVRAGTHNLLGNSNPVHRLIENGTHNFITKNPGGDNSRKRVADGTHNFITPWTCQHCGKSGKNATNLQRWHGDNCKLFKIVPDPR